MFQSSGLPISFILWYINAHKLIAPHCCTAFCPNTKISPWLYLLFYWDPHGFLYIFSKLLLSTVSSVNYILVLTMWKITRKEPQVFEIILFMFISTWIDEISHIKGFCSKSWCSSHFSCQPDICFVCAFLSCCNIFNRSIDFRFLWYVFT